jgi:peptide/nickel transport system substrate-binding protein
MTHTYSLHSDFYGQYSQNPTGTNNPEIDRLTLAMRSLEPTQKDEYLELWFEYQQVWNELLPQLPIYSNTFT